MPNRLTDIPSPLVCTQVAIFYTSAVIWHAGALPLRQISKIDPEHHTPISHFGVSRGFDFLLMTPGGTVLYIRARNRRPKNTHKIHFGVSEGFVYLGATIKENIHI